MTVLTPTRTQTVAERFAIALDALTSTGLPHTPQLRGGTTEVFDAEGAPAAAEAFISPEGSRSNARNIVNLFRIAGFHPQWDGNPGLAVRIPLR